MAPIAWDGSNLARRAFRRIEHSSFKTPVQNTRSKHVRIADVPTTFATQGIGVKFVVGRTLFGISNGSLKFVNATMAQAAGTRFDQVT